MIKQLTILFVAASIILSTTSLNAQENGIVGEWVSVERSQGGLGGTKTYTTDGTVSSTYGALLDYKYKLVGSTLSLIGDEGSIEQEVTFVGSNMILKCKGTGQEQKLTRIDETDGSGIVGKWTGKHYTGGEQIMYFTTNLNCYFSVPMMSIKGKYTLNNDTLVEEFEGKGKTEWKWSIQDDILTLTKVGGDKIEKYRRKN